MEKPVKFVLPAPNFEKNAAPKAQPHYLTPSGMTLLTRERQPPPMFGPRGSTVPSKFLQNKQPNEEIKPPPEEPPKRPFCEPCEMELQSVEDFRRHRSQHERCPVDDCKFKGHPSVMDKHVIALHSTGLFDKIKKLSTPEEIAAWREERRRKYPTLANAKMRQLAKEQRERRGERLGESKARFGRIEDRKRARENNNKRDTERAKQHPKRMRNNEYHYKKHKEKETGATTTIQKKPNESKKQVNMSDVPKEKETVTTSNKKPTESNKRVDKSEAPKATNVGENDDLMVCGIKMFKGTSQLSDYKHEKTKLAKVKNALSTLVGMYGGSDDDEDVEDDDTESDEDNSKTVIKNSELQKNDNLLEHVLVEDPEKQQVNAETTAEYNQVNPKMEPCVQESLPAENCDVELVKNVALTQATNLDEIQHKETNAENTQINQKTKPCEQEPLPAEKCDVELVENVTLSQEIKPAEVQHKEAGVIFEDTARKDEAFEALTIQTTNISEQKTNESSDEAPEEVPIERISTMPEIDKVASNEARSSNQAESIEAKRLRIEQSRKQAQQQRQYNLNIRRRKLRKQNTMLEKLLEPEIRHERNVLLQCVRFVCENNFFGIGGVGEPPVSNEEKNKLETS